LVLNEYNKNRGMSLMHDVDDWLGGYPYESMSEEEINSLMSQNNFKIIKAENVQKKIGFFGSGCSEWVVKKINYL
jgi:2-polyprenyl-6-hydroxyphenyl methylase/3-demethylubiquinone-9 3-methyltransferase